MYETSFWEFIPFRVIISEVGFGNSLKSLLNSICSAFKFVESIHNSKSSQKTDNSELIIKNVNINHSRIGVITILKKMGVKIIFKNQKSYGFISKIEKPLIETTLNLFRGNQIKASKCLGFNRNTLRSKINLYGIEVVKKRKA